jgi:hypothetical protein
METRKLNPPSFYSKDKSYSDEVYELYLKAEMKVDILKKSKCIEYELFGGGIARDRDVSQAQKVSNRIFKYYEKVKKNGKK